MQISYGFEANYLDGQKIIFNHSEIFDHKTLEHPLRKSGISTVKISVSNSPAPREFEWKSSVDIRPPTPREVIKKLQDLEKQLA